MPNRELRLLALLIAGALSAMPGHAQTSSPGATAAPAAAQGAPLKQEQLEQILAPVALYPDPLLAQILMASTYPLEIVEAARWRKANPDPKDKALEDALQQQPWDPSVKSLTAFPQVLQMMNEKLSWTQQLGDAFLADQQGVMRSVQKLRKAAHDQGNLASSKEQNVVVEKESTQTIIKIEPADPQVVYVPSYNPTVVYGTWPYPSYPPYYYYYPGYAPGAAFWTFTAGVIVGGALWGNCNWGRGDIDIDINRQNNFSRTNNTNRNWSHNTEHRRGVSYKDQRTAEKYNRGANARDAQSREQFRGRAESGRSELGQQRLDSGSRPATADRAGAGGRDSVGSRDVDRGAADRAGSRDVGGGRDSAGTRDAGGRDFSGGRQASGFGGADQGRQAHDFSSRGQSSRAGSFSGGGGARAGGRAGGGGRGGRR